MRKPASGVRMYSRLVRCPGCMPRRASCFPGSPVAWTPQAGGYGGMTMGLLNGSSGPCSVSCSEATGAATAPTTV